MDIQARKLNLIEEFIRITDEKVITKIESFLHTENKGTQNKGFNPMSMEEFHEMIDRSIDDRKNGRVVSHEELLEEIKSWK
ncbi:MAG: hypothetical protein K9H64_18955 [Bacteroidales bacterium]|nr:hypothetical protein [Bacteroidales bacterium]MCF8458100.1 hypothetical protein [Bacteroidales bacterium]